MTGDDGEAILAKNEEWLDHLFQVTKVSLELNGLDMSRCSVSLVIQYAQSDAEPEGSLAYVGQVTAQRMLQGAQRWVEEERTGETVTKSALARIMEKRV